MHFKPQISQICADRLRAGRGWFCLPRVLQRRPYSSLKQAKLLRFSLKTTSAEKDQSVPICKICGSKCIGIFCSSSHCVTLSIFSIVRRHRKKKRATSLCACRPQQRRCSLDGYAGTESY